MQLYIQFLFCLVFGLVGLCSALKILFETLFKDWDPIREVRDSFDPAIRRRPFIADWQLGRGIDTAREPLLDIDSAGEA